MAQPKSYLILATLLFSGVGLSSCNGRGNADQATTTPSNTLGTDSAATKVGGMPETTSREAAGAGSPTGATATGAGTTIPNTGK